jgi:hypothetical protein
MVPYLYMMTTVMNLIQISCDHCSIPAAGTESLSWRDTREEAGRDRRAAEGSWHDGENAKVAEAADEFGRAADVRAMSGVLEGMF